MNHEKKRAVTLEDLLHLKRAERPPAEFWTAFERDLRAKQLSALVEKRAWWRDLPRAFAAISPRYHLLLGASAAVAVAFVSMRSLHTTARVAPAKLTASAPVAAIAPSESVSTGARAPVSESPREPIATSVAVNAPTVTTTSTTAAAAPDTVRVVQMVAMLGDSAARDDSPSARSIAANMRTAQEFDPMFANNFLGSTRGFESRGLPARTPAIEPLAQVSTSEARRSRLLAAAIPVAFNNYSATSEKVARHITDERLYEGEVSRVGARGDRVSWKF